MFWPVLYIKTLFSDLPKACIFTGNHNNIASKYHLHSFLIDFGLYEYSDTVEDKSVDIHLLKRVLISSHGEYFKVCYNAFLEGYRLGYERIDKNKCEEIIKNVDAVESRGRYIKPEDRI